MTNAASVLGSEYDAFLFAPIGWDQNEMVLSVVSALARLDIDPWQEAAKLARLSRPAATSRLEGLLADLPDGTPARLDPRGSAACLVALLPSGRAGESSTPRLVRTTVAAPHYRVVAFILFAVIMASVQYVVASHSSAPKAEQANRAASTAEAKPSPSPMP